MLETLSYNIQRGGGGEGRVLISNAHFAGIRAYPVCTLVKKLPYSLGKKLVYSALCTG